MSRGQPRSIRAVVGLGLAVVLALASAGCEYPAEVDKTLDPPRAVTNLTDLERRQAIMDPSIYAVLNPDADLPIADQPKPPLAAATFNKYYAHNCGTWTCSIYFTVKTTKLIADKGYAGAAAAIGVGLVGPKWLTAIVTVVVVLVNGITKEAAGADPPRCATVRFWRYPLQVTSYGHVHPDNVYCRSGQ